MKDRKRRAGVGTQPPSSMPHSPTQHKHVDIPRFSSFESPCKNVDGLFNKSRNCFKTKESLVMIALVLYEDLLSQFRHKKGRESYCSLYVPDTLHGIITNSIMLCLKRNSGSKAWVLFSVWLSSKCDRGLLSTHVANMVIMHAAWVAT